MAKRKVTLWLADDAVKNLRMIASEMDMCSTAGNGSLSGIVNFIGFGKPEVTREALQMIAHGKESKEQ